MLFVASFLPNNCQYYSSLLVLLIVLKLPLRVSSSVLQGKRTACVHVWLLGECDAVGAPVGPFPGTPDWVPVTEGLGLLCPRKRGAQRVECIFRPDVLLLERPCSQRGTRERAPEHKVLEPWETLGHVPLTRGESEALRIERFLVSSNIADKSGRFEI